MKMRVLIFLLAALAVMTSSADAWIWGLPAKVDGIFYQDHFGGSYFYNDIGLLYVTEKQRALITPHVGKLVAVTVTGTYQLTIPGDIRLEQFAIGRSNANTDAVRNHVQLSASWNGSKKDSLDLNIKNLGLQSVSIYPGIIDFFALTTKDHTLKFGPITDVSDGPSTILGRERIFGWPQRSWAGTYSSERTLLSWAVRDGKQIKDTVLLLPDKSMDIIIDLQYSTGPYDIFFGYKVLQDSSFDEGRINDLVAPVVSNSILIGSNFLQKLSWPFWVTLVLLFALLGFRFFRFKARK